MIVACSMRFGMTTFRLASAEARHIVAFGRNSVVNTDNITIKALTPTAIMSFLRTVRQPALRPLPHQTRTFTFTSRRSAQDYGSGAGDPKGEKPQEQGKNPSEHKEHPGPPAPSTGGNSGSGQQQQQGGKEQSSKAQTSKGTQGAQPKILNESPPASGQGSQDVEDHNREMDQRAEKANMKVKDEDVEKDKVGKGFWSGKRDSTILHLA